MRVTLIVVIIGTIVIPLGIWWLNQSKPDIRFTLSDPIRIGQVEGGKIWQQMEVRNNGNIEAKEIQVKINAYVSSYELSKHSEADKPEIFTSQNIFELRYPSLPPSGLFAITLGSTKSKLKIEHISILHSSGRGSEAFSKNSLIWAPLGFALGMLFYILFCIYLWLIERVENLANWSSENYLKKKKKPWYLSEEKWSRLRTNAIDKIFRWSGTHQDIITTKSFHVLCEKRPEYLSNDEWNKFRNNAEDRFKENFTAKIQETYDSTRLISIFKIEKPVHILESTWIRLQKEANERFLILKQREIPIFNFEKFKNLLNEQSPEGVEPETWEQYLKLVEEKYVEEIKDRLRTSENSIDFLKQQNLSCISAENVSYLQDIAYKHAIEQIPDLCEPNGADKFLKGTKPEWMREKDYIKYTKMAQRTVDFEREKKEYEEKSTVIDEERTELTKTMNQVNSQLEIINKVLNDPTAIDRVEEHSNPFSKGNFENLIKISEFLLKFEDQDKQNQKINNN